MARHGISGDEVKERLQSFRDKLRNCIEPQFGLLDRLLSTGVLVEEEYEIMSKEPNSFNQCDVLLNIMQQKTPEQCEQFLDDLKATGQKHVVNFIVQNARRFNCNHTKFCYWPLEGIHRKRIMSNLDKLVNEIECKNNLLIDALVSCHCINDQQSQSIRAAPTLADMNRKLLTILLRRSIKDYNEFVECLEESGMQHMVQEFHLDIGDVGSVNTSEPSGPGGNATSSYVTEAQDPVPLLSSLAVSSSSASAAPLKSFQIKLVPQPSSQSDVMTQKTTERRMKGELFFTQTYPPVGSKRRRRSVKGVAIVGECFYVVFQRHENIYKYDENELHDVIEVVGMGLPEDMVADSERAMLFVSDSACGVIWRVSLDTREIEEFAKLDPPCRLSLVDTRLLVTSLYSLVMLDSLSGKVIRKFDFTNVLQSIETGRETLFVQLYSMYNKHYSIVTEMDFNGDVIHEFNCYHLANEFNCFHLALDSVGHRLFVADCSGRRIYVLNEELEFQGIFIDSKQLGNAQPCRLNYDKKNNRLAVGFLNGQVRIFEC